MKDGDRAQRGERGRTHFWPSVSDGQKWVPKTVFSLVTAYSVSSSTRPQTHGGVETGDANRKRFAQRSLEERSLYLLIFEA